MKNLLGFTFPHTDTSKTHPISSIPIRTASKTHPVLDPNRRRRTCRGVCFCAPTRVREKFGRFYTQILGAGHFGRMQYAPTRVREKPARFHISPPEYAKNAPDFTLSNRDTPKTHPVLDANLRRGVFRGVCNTPLHRCMQNLTGFTFPHPDTPKTHPISPFPIRIHQKRTRF